MVDLMNMKGSWVVWVKGTIGGLTMVIPVIPFSLAAMWASEGS